MTFISHAQNREDALLWRALGDVANGFYIDVGAGDPVYESVTKAFSLRGWRGINIEPTEGSYKLLCHDRPHDINLQVAAGDRPGTQRYYSVAGGNGLSTSVEAYATRYRDESWPVDEIEVITDTLANICAEHVAGDIHFLKIDTEGSEHAVLAGADFTRFRPWVVVVEAVEPMLLTTPDGSAVSSADATPVPTHDAWEPLLLEAGYTFAIFDGLNRFYVANEKADQIVPKLSTPVNVLDDVVLAIELQRLEAMQQDLEARQHDIESLRSETLQVRGERDAIAAERDTAAGERDAITAELQSVRASLDSTHARLGAVQAELDGAYQELYEGSRALSSFAAQVQRAEDEVAAQARVIAQQQSVAEHNDALSAQNAALTTELEAVYATKAWRITKPLRRIRALMPASRTR